MDEEAIFEEALRSIITLAERAVEESKEQRMAEASYTFTLLSQMASSLSQDLGRKALNIVREAVFSQDAIAHVNEIANDGEQSGGLYL